MHQRYSSKKYRRLALRATVTTHVTISPGGWPGVDSLLSQNKRNNHFDCKDQDSMAPEKIKVQCRIMKW